MAPEDCEVIRMARVQGLDGTNAARTRTVPLSSLVSVTRRHVDLLRVSSALCPGDTALV